MEKLRVVFMGTPDFAVPVLEGLIEHYDVVAVVSQPDKKVGRHQRVVATPVKEVALRSGIVVLQPHKIKEEYEDILSFSPDIIVTCAYGQILPRTILEYPKYGCINVHASLLPKLRGGAPIHKAIIDGYHETGITIMYMDVGMDEGDIISQKKTEILDSDNLETLHDRLSLLGKELLLETLPDIIQGKNKRIAQDSKEATYAYNIQRAEEHIDFSKTPREIFNQIRGLSPVPGAYLLFDGQEMKVYASLISTRPTSNTRFGFITRLCKEGIGVATGDGEIILTEIKPFGKKRMSASSYICGLQNRDIVGKELQ